jgi:hypothetical protein
MAFQTLTFSLKIAIAPEGMETLQTLHTSSSSSSHKTNQGWVWTTYLWTFVIAFQTLTFSLTIAIAS